MAIFGTIAWFKYVVVWPILFSSFFSWRFDYEYLFWVANNRLTIYTISTNYDNLDIRKKKTLISLYLYNVHNIVYLSTLLTKNLYVYLFLSVQIKISAKKKLIYKCYVMRKSANRWSISSSIVNILTLDFRSQRYYGFCVGSDGL